MVITDTALVICSKAKTGNSGLYFAESDFRKLDELMAYYRAVGQNLMCTFWEDEATV